jgi:hypothetical protein
MLRMIRTIGLPASLGLSLLALSACGSHTSQNADIYNPENAGLPPQQQNGTAPSLFSFGKGSTSSGGSTAGNSIQVNAYLWRASLDTLAFMPLVSADPFGGVIITDWYVPPATPNERFKADAYILSQKLTANALTVTVFHQEQQNGQWVDVPVDPATASGLEDRILARAADLQAEAQNTK